MLLLLPLAFASGVQRSLPTSVEPNTVVVITLTATQVGGDYFAIVREDIPTGWTYVSGGSQDGNQVKMILTSLVGNPITYRLRSGTVGTTSFSGTFQFAEDLSPSAIVGVTTVLVQSAGGTTPTCGDGVCDAGESTSTCASDCPSTGPTCGDGVCETGESTSTCAADCPAACTPNWDCAAWSNATKNCGTRTCTDLNGCGVTTGKPTESKSCDACSFPEKLDTDTGDCEVDMGSIILLIIGVFVAVFAFKFLSK